MAFSLYFMKNLDAFKAHGDIILAEYRTALITAATTGKIDVRQVKIPAAT